MIQNPSNGFYIAFSPIFSKDKNIIQVYDNEDIKLLYQNLINIILKSVQYIGQSKRHYLVLKMAIAGFENRILFFAFLNPLLIIDIGEIKLDKVSSLAKSIL